MIYINKNSTNDIVLTLTEKATLQSSDWLFVFTNDITGELNKKIFSAHDISVAQGRYNEFHIIDNVTELPYNGQMNFKPTGYWSYTVYEMNVNSPPDLNPLNAVGIAESGKALVFDPNENKSTAFDKNDSKNTAAFDL